MGNVTPTLLQQDLSHKQILLIEGDYFSVYCKRSSNPYKTVLSRACTSCGNPAVGKDNGNQGSFEVSRRALPAKCLG